MWQVVSNYIQSMPDGFVKAALQFDETVVGKIEYQRWSACIQELMVPMDMTMARMFVDAHFDENIKSTVRWSFRCGYTGNRSGKIKLRVWLLLSDVIFDFHFSHCAICCSQKNLHINCSQFLLGVINVPWKTENQTFAKCLGDKQIRMANVKVAYRELKQRWRRWGWKHQKSNRLQKPKGLHHVNV